MTVDTTKEILFLILALAIVVLTFFCAWVLYYIVSIIRQAHGVMKEVSDGVQKLHEILDSIRETIHQSSSHLGLIVAAVRKIGDLYTRRREKRADREDDNEGRDSEPRRGRKK
ncbi:MAG: DUF948 domain-containing protein [bacterium]